MIVAGLSPCRRISLKEKLLSINNLSVRYQADRGQVRAVSNVSFTIHKGEFFGLAGESGCGKSTIAFAIMRLLKGAASVPQGEINFAGRNLLTLGREGMRTFRWEKASMVLQSAMNNLNPVITIGSQLSDAIRAHRAISKAQAIERAAELLTLVNISTERLQSFPHELSGGMRQRVVIAMALALEPELIILDEPTTALDVVVQFNIVRRIIALKKKMGFSILFITHDLPLMLSICDSIGIMYAGKLVERASASQLKLGGSHPYSSGLLKAFPSLIGEKKRLCGIPGSVPDLITPPEGCLFYDRCHRRQGICREKDPKLVLIANDWYCACHFPDLRVKEPV